MRLALLLVFAPVLYGQLPGWVPVQAGALSCGLVTRSHAPATRFNLQIYCYAGTLLVWNSIAVMDFTAVPVANYDIGWGDDTTKWHLTFDGAGTKVAYEVIANGITKSGTLDAVYGTPPPSCKVVGFRVDAVCHAFNPTRKVLLNGTVDLGTVGCCLP